MLKINGNYLILDTNVTTSNKKKITGHSFVALANLDQYNKRGDAVLQLLGYYKSNVDPKFLKRGNMGEKMIEFILKKKNEEYKSYSEEDKRKNKWDFFPEYRQCGGIPDFEIPKKSTMIEVKSKSLNKYDEIKKEIPSAELWQGLYYGYLRMYDTLQMAYVFFDAESENLLFNDKKPKTLDNCKVMFKKYNINDFKVKETIKNALNYYNGCIEYKAIPLEDISPDVLKHLQDTGVVESNGM